MQRIAITARSAGPALTSAWVASVPWAIGMVLANPLGVVARFALGHAPNVALAGEYCHNPSRLPRQRELRHAGRHELAPHTDRQRLEASAPRDGRGLGQAVVARLRWVPAHRNDRAARAGRSPWPRHANAAADTLAR